MNIRTYRLPVGVDCSIDKGLVSIRGARGVVTFNTNNRLYLRGNIANFAPTLDPYYSSIFAQGSLGVILGYAIEMKFKGIGYRVRKEARALIFFLGYSLPIRIDIPIGVFAIPGRKKIILKSANLGLLRNFASTIRSYRSPDPYKGNGILYEDEVLSRKEGKKS